VARAAQTVLRSVLPQEGENRFIGRTGMIVRLVIFGVTAAALTPPALRLAGASTHVGRTPEALAEWALDAGLKIALIAIAAYFVIRVGSAASRRFQQEMSRGTGLDVVERTKRAKTLGGLIQKTLQVAVISVAALMILNELKIDIRPVLTGAGIVGLAVGFGAQTLVRDVISGFFLILEDQVRVGDVATVNGQGGLVEAVNLRTMVLRDENGAVHVFPNGEVKTLANQSKDFSYFVISLPVSWDQDPEAIMAAMRDAATAVEQDAEFKAHILAPMEIYGIDTIEPGQFTVKGRIKTVALKQWTVGRAMRGRLLKVLRERGLEIPRPAMQVYMGPDRRAPQPAAKPPQETDRRT
jgi:small conductance mechanosensitive channel